MAFETLRTLQLARELHSEPASDIVDNYADWARQQFTYSAGQSTPVLICARNEAADLPAALVSLARSYEPVQPIVVDNGSEDETAVYAKKMGAIVVDEPEIGETVAYQTGLRFVKAEMPKTSVLLATDGDTIVNPLWSGNMATKASRLRKTGGVTFGLGMVAGGESIATDLLRTTVLNAKQIYVAVRRIRSGARGYNTALTFDYDQEIYNALLGLPNVFPGNDRAIRDSVIRAGGIAKPNVHPGSAVITRGDRYTSIRQYLSAIRGRITPREIYGNDYVDQYGDATCV